LSTTNTPLPGAGSDRALLTEEVDSLLDGLIGKPLFLGKRPDAGQGSAGLDLARLDHLPQYVGRWR
jgi:hypothetical protein